MKKGWLLVVGLALAVAIVGLAGCSQGSPGISAPASLKVNLNGQQEGIFVTGQGEVSAVPDLATVNLGIQAQEASVSEAQAKAADAMAKVMAALADNGVAEKDIQTRYFNIQKVTRWDNDKQQEIVIGYQVSNMVTVKVRDLEKVGPIIDVVSVAGGDLTRVDSIGFSVEDQSSYLDEARQKAVADAAAKAQQLADMAGVKLGKPTYISEGISYPSPVYPQQSFARAEAAPAAAPTPISPGETKITLTVSMAYAILD